MRPTSGSAFVNEIDAVREPVRVRSQLAVVPQRNNLDRALSIRRNLIFHAAYHGMPARTRASRADELLDQFGLLERADTKPDFFSGGQAQRVMIARALMHDPKVLFLDEPTTGLDPAARLFVWDRLRELQERGVTLFLTTHDMEEAESLADRVGIMDHGKLLALDTPSVLVRSLPGRSTLELTIRGLQGVSVAEVVAALAALGGVERVEEQPASLETSTPESGAGPDLTVLRLYLAGEASPMVAPVAALLDEKDLSLTDVSLGTATLEDVFIDLTGRTLR
ncbi:MAG: type transport system ATP-binding protein [Actinomycetota bacterium]|nr:type transport system ATP-binding protein [Actinomycetota bacterium]